MNGNRRSFSFRILVNRVAAFLARPAELDFLQYADHLPGCHSRKARFQI